MSTAKLNLPVRSRWLDWQPQKFEGTTQAAPTKPTEPGFDGFVGASSGDSQKIGHESMEAVLKGKAIELWSDALGERFWLVADEADAARLGERRGSVYTASEARRMIQVGDRATVAEIHRWKRQFDGIVSEYRPEGARRGSRLQNVPEKREGPKLVRIPDSAQERAPVVRGRISSVDEPEPQQRRLSECGGPSAQ